jgi:hypothetical protein
VSKCVVSWCPEPGLDTGLLPGLCVEHRDETLGKQKVAVETVKAPGYEMRVAGRFELPEPAPAGTLTREEMEARSKEDPSRIFQPTRDGYIEMSFPPTPTARCRDCGAASRARSLTYMGADEWSCNNCNLIRRTTAPVSPDAFTASDAISTSSRRRCDRCSGLVHAQTRTTGEWACDACWDRYPYPLGKAGEPDRVTRHDGACGVTGCRNVGVRAGGRTGGRVLCALHTPVT